MRRRRIAEIAVIAVMLAGGAHTAFSEATEEFNRTYSLREGAPVRVSNVSGKVVISTWDDSRAEVRAVKRTRGDREELSRASVEVHADGVLDIETRYQQGSGGGSFLSWLFGGNGSNSNVSVDYFIRIPKTAVLERVHTTSADIEIRDTVGDASLHTVSGTVTTAGTKGALDIRTTSGDVRMEGGELRNIQTVSGSMRLRGVRGRVHAQSTSGDIQAEGAGGPLDARTISGDIRFSGLTAGEVSSVSGDIQASPAGFGDQARFGSVSGNINLRLPEKTNVELVLETTSGDLVNQSGQSLTATQISRRRLTGRIGSGGKTLSIHTTSGDITLE